MQHSPDEPETERDITGHVTSPASSDVSSWSLHYPQCTSATLKPMFNGGGSVCKPDLHRNCVCVSPTPVITEKSQRLNQQGGHCTHTHTLHTHTHTHTLHTHTHTHTHTLSHLWGENKYKMNIVLERERSVCVCVCVLPEAVADAHSSRWTLHILNDTPIVTVVLNPHTDRRVCWCVWTQWCHTVM